MRNQTPKKRILLRGAAAALALCMVLGFMATIYVSGERVYAPLYGILLAVTLFGICRQRSVWKGQTAVSSAVFLTALTAVCCVVNVLFIVLSL